MLKILVLGEQPQFRTLLSESLWHAGYLVESVDDAGRLWQYLGRALPDLILLDAHSDGFGAMTLYQELIRQFPNLTVIEYQCRNYSDVARVKRAVADALGKQILSGSACEEPRIKQRGVERHLAERLPETYSVPEFNEGSRNELTIPD